MVAPVHYRVRVGGLLYSDASWSVGIGFGRRGGANGLPADPGDATGFLEDWADAIKALNNGNVLSIRLRQCLSVAGNINMIRVSRIGAEGRETAVAIINVGEPPAGDGNALHDAQTAIAVSLQTGRPGASYRGRFYMPALGLGLSQGRFGALPTQELATDAAGWLNQVGDAAPAVAGTGVMRPIVASNTRSVLTEVTSVRVGNRLDSQRRRAESQEEVYGVAAVPE